MLTANKNAWFERVFAVYNRHLFKRRFHSLKISGLETLRNRAGRKTPLIIYANHSSWWDGLVAFEISRIADFDAFVMMEERQLKKLFLFRRLGAFSVVRERPRQAVESINYAAALLDEKSNRVLWIFPQGEILPNDSRPLKFYRGAAKIIEKLEKCDVLPLAMRYEFGGEFKPEIYVKAGAVESIETDFNFNAKLLTTSFEEKLIRLLDDLKNDFINTNLGDYSKIF